jgi:hypothetical protein
LRPCENTDGLGGAHPVAGLRPWAVAVTGPMRKALEEVRAAASTDQAATTDQAASADQTQLLSLGIQ